MADVFLKKLFFGCATKADALAESQTLIGVLETAMSSLKEVGRRELL